MTPKKKNDSTQAVTADNINRDGLVTSATRHQIVLEPQSIAFEVEDGESIINGALRQGIPLPHGCRNGQCGTCKARVSSGHWQYLDGYSPALLAREETKQGMAVLCKVAPLSDLVIELDRPLKMKSPQRIAVVRVESIEPVTPEVARLIVRFQEDVPFTYDPGQYVDFLLEDGQRRSFSLARGRADNGRLEFHVKRQPEGLFSNALFTSTLAGDRLHIEGPLGSFRFDEGSSRPTIFIAEETGFAPVQSMLEYLLETERASPVWLYWGSRTAEGLYANQQLREWETRHEWFHFVPLVMEPDGVWPGKTGPAHRAVIEDHPDLSRFDIYMAGTPATIGEAKKVLPAFRHPEERLFCEIFQPAVTRDKKEKRFLGLNLRGFWGKG